MTQHLRERIRLQATQQFVGRAPELAHLLHLLDEQGTPVVFVHGIAGIGKSSLQETFARQAQALGAVVISLDCRAIKPSSHGFLHELSAAIGGNGTDVEHIALRLSRLGARVVLTLDTYELFRMMDTWLRDVFIPALPDNVHIVFFGREPPVAAWYTTHGWNGMVQSILLGALSNREAKALLLQCGLPETETQRVAQWTGGHPLALKLAAATIAERPQLQLGAAESGQVVTELAQLYLADASDPISRVVVEAACVVRRTTRSLLGALLPDIAPNDAYARLQALPFVEHARDGLMMHELVQHAIVAHLRAIDPARYSHYRRAAWRQLRSEFSPSSHAMSWRYTADMIYLIDHPMIHEVFFPSDVNSYAVEQATPHDWTSIQDITLRHDGPETLAMVQQWWNRVPNAFSVARTRSGEVAGYNCLLQVEPSTTRLGFDDPVTRFWWEYVQANPIPKRQLALFLLRSLGAEEGDRAHPVQGALLLDIKHTYLEHPQTRLVFSLDYTKDWIPFNEQLGFRLINWVSLDGKDYYTSVNDFGPQLVPGWLSRLVDTELGFTTAPILNIEARELVMDNTHITLTPLEIHLMQCLVQCEGKAVSRDDLLNEVWGYDYEGGSNVIDRVVNSLRKKFGEQAKCIETVSGVGYKLRWTR
jgi:hypothetical protein